jgi:FtsH-binding integral membrane protein
MSGPFATSADVRAATERVFLRQVFAWMLLGLAITTGVAVYLNATSNVLDYFQQHSVAFWLIFAAQLGLVIAIPTLMRRISAQMAAVLFCVYAALTGITFAILLAVYTSGSVVGAFAGATGVFGGMAIWGYTTEKDLSGWGSILFGALIGIIVASVVFAFVGGSTFNLIIGWAGVIIFSALTAYDMQKIKKIGATAMDEETAQKLAIFGALSLYLDFINLVISLLRIFGGRR